MGSLAKDLAVRITGDASGFDRAAKSAEASATAMTRAMNRELASQRRTYAATSAAQAKYFGELEAAEKRSSAVAAKAAAAEQARLTQLSHERKKAFDKFADLGKKAAMGATVAAAVSVHVAAKYQSAMELIHTQAGASQREVDKMSKSLLALAGPTATGPEELSKALFHVESTGFRGAKALEQVKVAAEGARMGGADLEEVTNALNAAIASGIPGVKNMDQAMGALNATVGSGDMRMQDLAEALGSGVLAVVKGYGLSLNDVGAALATFGDNNIRGANAATMLRMAVQSMAVPAAKGADELKKLGLTTHTLAADERTGGLTKALGDLHGRLEKLDKSGKKWGEILTEAFGKKAGPGLQVLIEQWGRYQSKVDEVNKGAGKFGEAWKATTQTFQYQQQQMIAELEVLGVKVGDFLIPKIEEVVGWTEHHQRASKDLAEAIGGVLVAAMGAYVIKCAIATASTAKLVVGMGVDAVVGCTNFVRGMRSAEVAAAEASGTMGTLGGRVAGLAGFTPGAVGIAALTIGISKLFADAAAQTHKTATGMQADMQAFADTGALTGKLAQFADASKRLAANGHDGGAFREVLKDAKGFDQALKDLAKSGDIEQISAAMTTLQKLHASGAIGDAGYKKWSQEIQKIALDTNGMTQAQLASAQAAQRQEAAINAVNSAIDGATSDTLSMRAAERDYQQAIDDASAAVKSNGRTLNIHTTAGRQNQSMLDNLAAASNNVTKSLIKHHKSQQDVTHQVKEARTAFAREAHAMGLAWPQAKALADQLIIMPDKRDLYIALHGAGPALAKLQRMRSLLSAISGATAPTGVYLPGQGPNDFTGNGQATGGLISGPGTGTSDSIPAMLSNGEFVVRASAVRAVGVGNMHRINSLGMARGGPVGYARGGHVTDPIAPLAGSSALIGLLGIPMASDVNSAWDTQRESVKAYREQLAALHKVERDRKSTHHERIQAEHDLAAARRGLSAATEKATQTERRFRAGIGLGAFGGKLGAGNRASAGFQGNLQKLAARGFGDLATELAAIGGAEGADLAHKAAGASSGQLRRLTSQIRTQNRQRSLGEHMDTALALISTLAHAKHPMSLGELIDTLHTDASTLVLLADLVGPTLRRLPNARGFLREAGRPGFRYGGLVGGAGGTDSNLIRATRGEFVVSPEGTAAFGPDRLAAISAMRFTPGAGYAGGSGGGGAAGAGGRQVAVNMHGTVIRETVDADLMWARFDFNERAASFGAGV